MKTTHTESIHSVVIVWVIVLILGIDTTYVHAQQLGASVMGSGGTTIQEHSILYRSTLGQASIGRVQSSTGTMQHNVGFWYTSYASIRRSGGAVVSLPRMEANLYDTIDVPLMLVSSANILGRNEGFTARIRYNSTLLKLLSPNIPISYKGMDAIIDITGDINQAQGILATLKFKVLMGDAPSTPLLIDNISIGTNNKYSVIRKNGEIVILDLCRAGDTTRLFVRGIVASIAGIRPNPVTSTAQIDITIGEEGYSSLNLLDLSGRTVAHVWEGNISKGVYTQPFLVNTLSSGTYFLQLQTANEIFVKQLIIQR